MCLQCVAKARMIKANILPGYFLVKATRDAFQGKDCEWPKGWYGWVRCNDPDFIWEGKPIPCPYNGMTDKEINNAPKRVHKAYGRWYSQLQKFEEATNLDLMVAYDLVRACRKAGYKPSRDGLNVDIGFTITSDFRFRGKELENDIGTAGISRRHSQHPGGQRGLQDMRECADA